MERLVLSLLQYSDLGLLESELYKNVDHEDSDINNVTDNMY